MNRPVHLLVLAAVLLVPVVARAQSLSDASDASDASAADDAGSEFAPVTPGPDAAVSNPTDGCDGLMLNAPCTLLGAAGFCFPNDVDGSDADLECVVDSDADTSGCNVAADASSAGILGGLAAFFGLALVGIGQRERRRRK